MAGIVRIDGGGPLGPRAPLGDGFDVVAGSPGAADRSDYVHKGDGIDIGVWDCDAGTLRLAGTSAHEYCLLIEGELSIIDAAGDEQRFGAGDAFVIPLGFVGLWVMHTRIRKHYVIIEGTRDRPGATR